MALPEFESDMDESLKCSHDSVIAIHDASFAWENEDDEADQNQPQESRPERRRRSKRKDKNERASNGPSSDPKPEVETLSLQQATELTDCLHLIQVEVKRGGLVGICGSGNLHYLLS